ncbi:MAG: purine-nucleoside phosphorylase [Ignavibacteria bacterium GWA2_54_16]|nr:MAG: purine-nucleoside phosphorylase [Ignavibacteria bacterium GWA2_54_16]
MNKESQRLHDSSRLHDAVDFLSLKTIERPVTAIVLGSGLGDFANQIADPIVIDSHAVPSYPTSSVQGHDGKLVFGRLRDQNRESLPLLVFKGRVHYYESGDLQTPIFPIEVAKALGVKNLLVTNAAGGINRSFASGDLMLITDFINLAFLNPHRLSEEDRVTPFHAKNKRYLDEHLSGLILSAAERLQLPLQRGTYCWLKGPSYETKAEIEMLHRLGADAVGMSTVPEMIAAVELGMRTAGISLISNLAAGFSAEPLSHNEVSETASRVKQTFIGLLSETILSIKN